MPIEGEIAVRIDRAAGRVARVTIRSTRPLATARVVVGRRVGEAARLVPRLYSVCANAQGAASASALAAARGQPPSPSSLAAQAFAVALENLQEDLRRLLMDIPRVLGELPQVAPVATARRSFAPVLSVLPGTIDADAVTPDARRHATDAAIDAVADHVLGEAPSRFAARSDADALERWAREAATAPARVLRAVLDRDGRLGASDVPTLPSMTRERVEATLLPSLAADAAFPAAPRVDGAPRETGALARMAAHPAIAAFVSRHGRGVASRLAARVGDVARTSAALAENATPARIDAWATRDGAGVALVETARGLLLHRAEVRGDTVTGYGVVAPTEWNFQPGGPLERSLAGLDAADAQALHRDAALVVQSLDPCVACGIEVRDA
jgi:hypothetical protein